MDSLRAGIHADITILRCKERLLPARMFVLRNVVSPTGPRANLPGKRVRKDRPRSRG